MNKLQVDIVARHRIIHKLYKIYLRSLHKMTVLLVIIVINFYITVLPSLVQYYQELQMDKHIPVAYYKAHHKIKFCSL